MKKLRFYKHTVLFIIIIIIVLAGVLFYWFKINLRNIDLASQKTGVINFEQTFQVTEPSGNQTVTSSPEFVIKGIKSADVGSLSLIIDYNWSGIYIPIDLGKNTWEYSVSLHPGSNEYQFGVYDHNHTFLGSKDIDINYDDQRIKTEYELCLSSLVNMNNFDVFANYNNFGDSTYVNANWGISFDFSSDWSGCTKGIKPHSQYDDSHSNDPLYNIQLNGAAVKIFGQETLVPQTGEKIADYLNAYYPLSNYNIDELQTSQGKSYKVTKKDGKLIEGLYAQKFLTLFAKNNLVYVVELGVQEGDDTDQSQLEGFKKIADSFKFIKSNPLPAIKLPINEYRVAGYSVYALRDDYYCRFGLKCVSVQFGQDGGDLIAVDYMDRYDYGNFSALSDYNESLLSKKIVSEINSGKIKAYQDEYYIYLQKGLLVYLIDLTYFQGNIPLLKKFSM